jgi:hypothetical protein
VKSQKMVEPHVQAQNARARMALGVWSGTRTGPRARAREVGRGPRGRQARVGLKVGGAHVSRDGWVDRPARRLVLPLGLDDGPIDPSS